MKLSRLTYVMIFITSFALTSCGGNKIKEYENYDAYIDDNYRDYYQILPYTFADSNGDKIGDLKGITQKLDYLNSGVDGDENSLGVTGIYTLPIFKSPSYHKYDVIDYYNIDPVYGTMEDFEELVEEAHKRGINIMLDMPFNHTSNQNKWFKEAIKGINSQDCDIPDENNKPSSVCISNYPYVNYYNFDYSLKLAHYNIPGTEWFYEGVFSSEMPDLNLKNQAVLDEIKNILYFWLDKGVDGFRLDAVTSFSSLRTESFETINEINEFVKEKKKDAFVVAEGPWNSELYEYYQNTQLDSYMNFTFGNHRIIDSLIKNQDITPMVNEIKRINRTFDALDHDVIDSNFLTNHDLTREANAIYDSNYHNESLARLKMVWGINHLMSGTSYVYYGEEIGMRSGPQTNNTCKDPNKRYPMYWSENDKSMTTNYAPGATVNNGVIHPLGALDEQLKDNNSLVKYFQKLLSIKKFHPEISRGRQEIVYNDENCYIIEKTYQDSKLYLVYNVSSSNQTITLDENINDGVEIQNMLLTNKKQSSIKNKKINVPSYSITILK